MCRCTTINLFSLLQVVRQWGAFLTKTCIIYVFCGTMCNYCCQEKANHSTIKYSTNSLSSFNAPLQCSCKHNSHFIDKYRRLWTSTQYKKENEQCMVLCQKVSLQHLAECRWLLERLVYIPVIAYMPRSSPCKPTAWQGVLESFTH